MPGKSTTSQAVRQSKPAATAGRRSFGRITVPRMTTYARLAWIVPAGWIQGRERLSRQVRQVPLRTPRRTGQSFLGGLGGTWRTWRETLLFLLRNAWCASAAPLAGYHAQRNPPQILDILGRVGGNQEQIGTPVRRNGAPVLQLMERDGPVVCRCHNDVQRRHAGFHHQFGFAKGIAAFGCH